VYRQLTTLTAIVMITLGVVMIGVTIAHGFGVGILLGLLFIAAGTGRLYVLRGRR
jgi:MFS superfamily sulfate permease-like transporter